MNETLIASDQNDRSEPQGVAREITDGLTALALALPSWLDWLSTVLVFVAMWVVVPAVWSLLLIENLFLWPRSRGFKRTAALYGSVILGLALGFALIYWVPRTSHIGWWPLAGGYVILAIIFAYVSEGRARLICAATTLGILWWFLLFSMFR